MKRKKQNRAPVRCWVAVKRRPARLKVMKHRCAGVRSAISLIEGYGATAAVTDAALMTGGRMLTWSSQAKMDEFVDLLDECIPSSDVRIFLDKDEIQAYRERLHDLGRLRSTLASRL